MDIHGYSHTFTMPTWVHPFDQSITPDLPLPASRGLEAWQVDYDDWIRQSHPSPWIPGSNPIQWSSGWKCSEISINKPWVPNGISVSTRAPPEKKKLHESVILDRFVGLNCVQVSRNQQRSNVKPIKFGIWKSWKRFMRLCSWKKNAGSTYEVGQQVPLYI